MHRFTCIAVAAALLSTTVGAQAQSTPLRGDILVQCPALAEQLPELLASTKQSVDRHGSVQLAVRVDTDGRLRVEQLDGPRAYLGATRLAVEGLQCPSALAQRYSLTVRFADEFPGPGPALRQLASR